MCSQVARASSAPPARATAPTTTAYQAPDRARVAALVPMAVYQDQL